MRVERAVALAARLADVLAERVEQDALEEDARLRGLHLRDEDARRGVCGLRRPALGARERKDARPRGERGNDLEGFWERAGRVFGEEEADSGVAWRSVRIERKGESGIGLCVDLDDLWVEPFCGVRSLVWIWERRSATYSQLQSVSKRTSVRILDQGGVSPCLLGFFEFCKDDVRERSPLPCI